MFKLDGELILELSYQRVQKTFWLSVFVCLTSSKGGKTTKMSTALQTFASRAINQDKSPGWEPALPPRESEGQDSTPPTPAHTHHPTPFTSSELDQTKLAPLACSRLRDVWSADQSSACKIKTGLAAKHRRKKCCHNMHNYWSHCSDWNNRSFHKNKIWLLIRRSSLIRYHVNNLIKMVYLILPVV